jgi:hypothetical protein
VPSCGLGVDFDRYTRGASALSPEASAETSVLPSDAGADSFDTTSDAGGSFCEQRADATFCTDFTDLTGWSDQDPSGCNTCTFEIAAPYFSPPGAFQTSIPHNGGGRYLQFERTEATKTLRVDFQFRGGSVGTGADAVAHVIGIDLGSANFRVFITSKGTFSLEQVYVDDGGTQYGEPPVVEAPDVRGTFARVTFGFDLDANGGGPCHLIVNDKELSPDCHLDPSFHAENPLKLYVGFLFAQNSSGTWSASYDDLALYAQ